MTSYPPLASILLVLVLSLPPTAAASASSATKRSAAAVIPAPPDEVREYCNSDAFHPQCWRGEVIVMHSAVYGRMKVGTCIKEAIGFLGCQADVLHVVDRKCSGRQECQITNIEGGLQVKPCNDEVKSYLEAGYTCRRVYSPDAATCAPGSPLHVGSSPGHLLGDLSAVESPCGVRGRPWVLEAQPGQRINLTLLDFGWAGAGMAAVGEGAGQPAGHRCRAYGRIVDPEARTNVTLCGGRGRYENVHISQGNTLHVILDYRADQHARFLLQFEALGCPNLRAPKDAWLKREDGEVVIGCEATRQTWHLKCRGQQWVGVIGNCTRHLVSAQREAQTSGSTSPIPHGVAIVLIVGIALIICFVIVGIGFLFIRRYSRRQSGGKNKGQIKYNNVRTEDDQSAKAREARGRVAGINTISKEKAIHRSTGHPGGYLVRNDYSHVWDVPLPPDPKQDTDNNNPYRGSKGGTDSAYGGSAVTRSNGSGGVVDENYHVSIASRAGTEDSASRYFVLDRDAVIQEDPDC